MDDTLNPFGPNFSGQPQPQQNNQYSNPNIGSFGPPNPSNGPWFSTTMNYGGGPRPYPSNSPQEFSSNNSVNPVRTPFTGKFIADERDILPNDVPMDGRLSLFPSKDMSVIVAKAWTANGNMNTVRYIPDPDQFAKSQAEDQEVLNDILRRLGDLESSLKAKTVASKRKDDQNA